MQTLAGGGGGAINRADRCDGGAINRWYLGLVTHIIHRPIFSEWVIKTAPPVNNVFFFRVKLASLQVQQNSMVWGRLQHTAASKTAERRTSHHMVCSEGDIKRWGRVPST